MDCQRCTYVLDDPERALEEAASWGTIDDCCRETLELAKLEIGLRRLMPSEQPAPELDASILLAASRRASALGAALPASGMGARGPLPSIGTSGTSWISRLRHWVTAPQVAMATVTALAVVIGVFYVPSQRMVMQADGDTVMSVPSTTAAPVGGAPGASAPFGNGVAPKPDGVGTTASSAVPTGVRPSPMEPLQERAAAPSPSGEALGASDEIAAEQSAAVAGLGRGADSDLALNDAPTRRADEPFAEAEESRDHVARSEASPPAPPASTRMASRAADPTTTTASAGARSAALTTMTTPTAAPAPAVASSGAGAGPAAQASAPTAAGPELLAQARALRARGQCAAAVPLYDRYLAEPGAGARGDATIELAQCLVATGHASRARQLYERATAMPAVASRARAGLDAMAAGSVAAGSATGRAATSGPAAGAPTTRARAGAASSEAAAPGDSRIQLDAY